MKNSDRIKVIDEFVSDLIIAIKKTDGELVNISTLKSFQRELRKEYKMELKKDE